MHQVMTQNFPWGGELELISLLGRNDGQESPEEVRPQIVFGTVGLAC